MKNQGNLWTRVILVLVALATIILLSEWDGYKRAKSKYDIPPAQPESILVQIDTLDIIQRATAGMVPYDPSSGKERSAALDQASKEVARLNAWLDSLTGSLDSADIHGDSIPPILFPSLEADSLLTWSGSDSLSGATWSADLDHSQVIIPLLGQVRNSYSLQMEFHYPPAGTTYIDHGGNQWTWWEKSAVVIGLWAGWKIRSDIQ